eukprot:scaffold3544_cov373-Prasinococcus_capsulatus_cf.AAC.7
MGSMTASSPQRGQMRKGSASWSDAVPGTQGQSPHAAFRAGPGPSAPEGTVLRPPPMTGCATVGCTSRRRRCYADQTSWWPSSSATGSNTRIRREL